jgi:hypothetical protein
MGGFQSVTAALNGIPRRIHMFYSGTQIIAHIGTTVGIQQVTFDQYGNLIGIQDRTPTSFVGGSNVGFTFDAIFDTTSNVVQLVAHVQPDAITLASAVKTTPYLGDIMGVSTLVPFSAPSNLFGGSYVTPSVSGGVACVQPFVFDFDSDGFVGWSAPNLPLTLGVTGGTSGAGQARVSAQKVVGCIPLRGGGAQSPAALMWSLSEVITASFVGSSSGEFAFTTVSPGSSMLSAASIIEYDGLYFWISNNRMQVFNGTVNEVPNVYNQDWFFDNLTPGYEARTFGFKVPRYGEIWWCAAMFGSENPNHAIIYNLRENVWYDTALPDGGRGAGFYAQGFKNPVMTGVDNSGSGYDLWLHEIGVDKVRKNSRSAIRSYFQTQMFGSLKDQQVTDKGLSFQQLEPDVILNGDMTVTLFGQANARAPLIQGPTVPLVQVPGTPQEQLVSFTAKIPNRLLRLQLESNVVGGNYIFGRNIGHGTPSDARITS